MRGSGELTTDRSDSLQHEGDWHLKLHAHRMALVVARGREAPLANRIDGRAVKNRDRVHYLDAVLDLPRFIDDDRQKHASLDAFRARLRRVDRYHIGHDFRRMRDRIEIG